MHERTCCHDEAANHQLPIAAAFCGGMFKLSTKFDADLLLYSLSHFECDGHTVHKLTQWCLPTPLTSTVKSSLFTHAYSSPLSLTARLHQCQANHSPYSNNSWTFSGQSSYIHSFLIYVCVNIHILNVHIHNVHTQVYVYIYIYIYIYIYTHTQTNTLTHTHI